MKLLLLDRPADESIVSKRKVEFFGPWAQLIKTPEDLVKPAFEPYSTADQVLYASNQAIEKAIQLLDVLSRIMPGLTCVNKGNRFWRLFLAHYIITLTGVVEDISIRQRALPEKDYILGFPYESRYSRFPPFSWNENPNFVQTDVHFRLYTMALCIKHFYKKSEFVDYRIIPERKLKDKNVIRIMTYEIGRVIRKIKNINKLMARLQHSNFYSLIYDCYPRRDLFYNCGTMILNKKNNNIKTDMIHVNLDHERRGKIKEYLPFPYGEIISLSLPVLAFEGLPILIKLAENKIGNEFKKIRNVYTHGQAFSGNDLQRVILSILAEKGMNIISIQHGTGASYFAHSGLFLERFIADKYIACGAGSIDKINPYATNETIVLPSIYLSGLMGKKKKKIKWDVLFVVLEENRFIKWLYSPLFPDMAFDYFSREKKLFDFFCKNKKSAIKIYPISYWGQAKWIRKRYPKTDLLIKGEFIDYSLSSQLVIIDYNSTAFLEMLALNQPFLATWNRRWFCGNNLFEEFIDKLIDVGVFYEEPEVLIDSYNKVVSKDIDHWWKEDRRQHIIKEMAKNIALTSDTVYESWRNEFIRDK